MHSTRTLRTSYHSSKLTRRLRNALDGSFVVLLIYNVAPETSTLKCGPTARVTLPQCLLSGLASVEEAKEQKVRRRVEAEVERRFVDVRARAVHAGPAQRDVAERTCRL